MADSSKPLGYDSDKAELARLNEERRKERNRETKGRVREAERELRADVRRLRRSYER